MPAVCAAFFFFWRKRTAECLNWTISFEKLFCLTRKLYVWFESFMSDSRVSRFDSRKFHDQEALLFIPKPNVWLGSFMSDWKVFTFNWEASCLIDLTTCFFFVFSLYVFYLFWFPSETVSGNRMYSWFSWCIRSQHERNYSPVSQPRVCVSHR